MPWTFYNSNGQRLSSAATNISVLDIDGATDIGADIADADLFIIDDGAGGTNRKTAASRIVTYVGANTDTRSGSAKFWALVDQTDQSISASYNVTSIADGGVGNTDFTIGTDFSSANWSCVASSNYGDNYVTSFAAGTIRCGSRTEGASPANVDVATLAVAGFGDQ